MVSMEAQKRDPLITNFAKDPGIGSECRDSSVDSGFFRSTPPSPPFSDTDSEIVETLNRNLTITKSTSFQDVQPETDNLVEEVYVAEDSWHHAAGLQVTELPVVAAPPYSEEGKYHAKVFMIPDDTTSSEELSSGEERTHFGPTEIISRPDVNQNKFNTFKVASKYLNYNSRPVNTNELNTVLNNEFIAQDERYYVNQAELGLIKCLDKIVVEDIVSERADSLVVVAIDLGTTYSGYAFRYTQHPTDKEIHMMRKWEGGDPGLNNQKTPTTLLLTPEQQFHSFGFAARDFFHDLEPEDARKWFYFDKFKKHLHNRTDINRDTTLTAANGLSLPALLVFSHALRYLAQQALSELTDHGTLVSSWSVRWVITVPAIWSHSAKQFIREAAYMAEICNTNEPEQLIIALEPEAAAIWCRNLHFNQLGQQMQTLQDSDCSFMVVDCGGGTVDITVHKLNTSGTLRELYKATGDPSGSLGVDDEFELLLGSIFGQSFMNRLRLERPAAYIELMLSFESRKRSASPDRSSTLNIVLPFAFIEFHRIVTGKEVSQAILDFGQNNITWSSQGMLRLPPVVMKQLFLPTLESIIKHVEAVLAVSEVGPQIKQVFLVGGFAESRFLQDAVRNKLLSLGLDSLIIPQGVALSILRGAVLFGLDSRAISIRKAQHTYGIGVLKPFQHGKHPLDKLVVKNEHHWCADIFDTLVMTNQTMRVGEGTIRRYTPANPTQTTIVLNIYCTDATSAKFVTDEGVRRVGTLKLDISGNNISDKPREILTRILFSNTEVSVSALDVETSNCVETDLNFMPQ